MIIKHVPMRTLRKSNVVSLVDYLTNTQGRQERVGEITVSNCHSDRHAAASLEMLNTQSLNQRARSDKTYHLIVSFRPGELPSAETLRGIEARICHRLGFGAHQRVSVLHHDTNNVHLHLAINKIHPTRYTLHEPYKAYRAFGELCDSLEETFHLERDHHQVRKTSGENRASDMERQAGTESLIGWMQRGCLEDLRAARTWEELHQVLRHHGSAIQPRGQGLVITDGQGIFVRASSVARDLSKVSLERRLGRFKRPDSVQRQKPTRRYEPKPLQSRMDTTALYARYQQDRLARTQARAVALHEARTRKAQHIDAAKRAGQIKRNTIKLTMRGRITKKLLYAKVSQTLRSDLRQIVDRHRRDCVTITARYQRLTWADWLRQRALAGDQEALRALRARDAARGLVGDTIMAVGTNLVDAVVGANQDHITKQGTIIYRVGLSAVRDDGTRLQVSREVTNEGIDAALRLALQKYGTTIAVSGSDAFKTRVAEVAAHARLTICFDDPTVEQQRLRYARDSQRPPAPDTPSTSPSTQAAPPSLTLPSEAVLRQIAERERKRLQVIRTPTVRRFEERDHGLVQFGSVEKIKDGYVALVHRQDETLVLPVDEATYERLQSFTRGRTLHLNASGAIRLGKGRRR
ncbi:MAG: relaxase/mobilization nuclease domain-containing protein [Nitrospira sp.]|nr:relaxase/mobilization nuclease domain-containing protein [Nitrospira sp.]